MKTENEVVLDQELENSLPDEAKSLIVGEGYHLTKEIRDLKVGNREQYEKACELGIANASILKKFEAFEEAFVAPLKLDLKRWKERFDKARELFSANDEKIRKALLSYQSKVDPDNIKTIHTDLGSATIQERKDWEIEDGSLIPQEFYKLDESKIGKIIRAGGSVPGIKIKTVLSTAFKAA
jgi:hypothetical protein